MKRYIITTGSVTYAIKGRDLLRRKGYRARVEKVTATAQNSGCGYSIILEDDDIITAEKILRNAGIKIQSISDY
ncbi:MAG: DUF3343 domain-containing protein [Clostridia bacterium]|nr:DUF3343 domain-containing protein [Clostridia bacterium]